MIGVQVEGCVECSASPEEREARKILKERIHELSLEVHMSINKRMETVPQ